MPINVDELQKRLEEIDGKFKGKFGSSSNRAQVVWRPVEAHTVRIVPHTPQFVELMFHYNVGDVGTVLCPVTFGNKCPICELRISLYKNGTDDDKKFAKELKNSWRFYAPIVVRGKTEEQVPMWWAFSRTVYNMIFNLAKNPEYGDISDPAKGTDLDIVVEKPKKKGEFKKTNVSPKRSASALSDANNIDRLINSIPDLMKEFKVYTYEEIKQIVDKWLTTKHAAPTAGDVGETIVASEEEEDVDEVFKDIESKK